VEIKKKIAIFGYYNISFCACFVTSWRNLLLPSWRYSRCHKSEDHNVKTSDILIWNQW